MPYQVLLKEAHSLVDEMPEEKIEYAIIALRNIYETSRKKSPAKVTPFVAGLGIDSGEFSGFADKENYHKYLLEKYL